MKIVTKAGYHGFVGNRVRGRPARGTGRDQGHQEAARIVAGKLSDKRDIAKPGAPTDRTTAISRNNLMVGHAEPVDYPPALSFGNSHRAR